MAYGAFDVLMGKPEALFERAMHYRADGDEQRACEQFARAAEKGYAPAQFEYGMCKVCALGCSFDFGQGAHLVAASAEAGFEPAVRRMAEWLFPLDRSSGLSYFYGDFLSREPARRTLWETPQRGFSVGECRLTEGLYEALEEIVGAHGAMGLHAASVSYYLRLSQAGDAKAAYCAAIARLACAPCSTVTEKRRLAEAAMAEMTPAVCEGIPQALFAYGLLIRAYGAKCGIEFQGVAPGANGYATAAAFYMAAAKQGFAPAQWFAACAMEDGVLSDENVGSEALLLACEGVEEGAAQDLGDLYYRQGRYDQARMRLERFALRDLPNRERACKTNYTVGLMRKEGLGGPADLPGAFACFECAHGLDPANDDATFELASCYYYYANGVQQDDKKAFELFSSIAARNAKAAYEVGRCYENGWGVEESDDAALAAYSVDVLADYPKALLARTQILIEQDGYDQGEVNALFKHGAECGGALCQAMWGEILAQGIGCDANQTQARYWFEKSAAQESHRGQYDLAKLLLGEGGRQNRERACVLLDASMEQGNESAKALRAELCDEDGEFERAYGLYSELADAEVPEGVLGKARHLLDGNGVAQDSVAAFVLVKAAAKAGAAGAFSLLGECYEKGLGVAADAVRAAGAYEQAANAGDPQGQYAYALCLMEGRGTDKNEKRARELMNESAKAGLADAASWLSEHAQKAADPLDELVGLESVKADIRQLRRSIEFAQAVAAQGGKVQESNHHMLFLGNPGTGKTTVARIIVDMLCDMGVLRNRTLVEVDRSKLVGSHWGEGLENTRKAIGDAMGGVLFVDEAYALRQSDNDALGGEVIDTLVKAMTDYADDLVIIMAGYEREMDEFLDSNSGLRSRFYHTLHFADYDADQLTQIFSNLMAKQGFNVDDDAVRMAHDIFEKARHGEYFGNGRFVANFAQSVVTRHMNVTFDPADPSTTMHIVLADIPK